MSSPQEIESTEPGDSADGTPGEFRYLVENNDIDVESLVEDGGDLVLEYHSAAGGQTESFEEIGIITTVFNEILVKNGTDVEMLYAEIVDPIEDQARGWGAETAWFERYNDGEMEELTLWNSVLNSRVFEEDLDGDGGGAGGSGGSNDSDVEFEADGDSTGGEAGSEDGSADSSDGSGDGEDGSADGEA